MTIHQNIHVLEMQESQRECASLLCIYVCVYFQNQRAALRAINKMPRSNDKKESDTCVLAMCVRMHLCMCVCTGLLIILVKC
jgi:hypothetical protein